MVRWLVLVLVLVGVAFPSVQAHAQAGGGDEPNPLEMVQGKWTQESGATSCRTSSELRVVGTELVETSAGGRASRKTISRAEGYEISLDGGRETILLTPNDENRIERVTASNSRQVQFRCSSIGVLVHRDRIGDRPSDPVTAQGAVRNAAEVLAESGEAVVIGDGGRWCGPVASLLLDAGRDISERGDAALIRILMRELSVMLPRRCPQAAKATVRIATPGTMEWSFNALKLANGNWLAKNGSWQRKQNAVYAANRADEQLGNLRESEPLVRPRTASAQVPAGAPPPQRPSSAKPPFGANRKSSHPLEIVKGIWDIENITRPCQGLAKFDVGNNVIFKEYVPGKSYKDLISRIDGSTIVLNGGSSQILTDSLDRNRIVLVSGPKFRSVYVRCVSEGVLAADSPSVVASEPAVRVAVGQPARQTMPTKPDHADEQNNLEQSAPAAKSKNSVSIRGKNAEIAQKNAAAEIYASCGGVLTHYYNEHIYGIDEKLLDDNEKKIIDIISIAVTSGGMQKVASIFIGEDKSTQMYNSEKIRQDDLHKRNGALHDKKIVTDCVGIYLQNNGK